MRKVKDEQEVSRFKLPRKHKDIICSKCGMTIVYSTTICWNCSEPMILNKPKGERTDEN